MNSNHAVWGQELQASSPQAKASLGPMGPLRPPRRRLFLTLLHLGQCNWLTYSDTTDISSFEPPNSRQLKGSAIPVNSHAVPAATLSHALNLRLEVLDKLGLGSLCLTLSEEFVSSNVHASKAVNFAELAPLLTFHIVHQRPTLSLHHS